MTDNADLTAVVVLTEEGLDELLQNLGNPWSAVRDALGDVYLIFGTEDDYAYQGVPQEAEDGSVDRNAGWLSGFPGKYPLIVLPEVSS